VSYGDARPGDLFFYPHHVAIYIGGGQIVHASTSSTGIIVGNAGYRPLSCIRRLL
ncbi:MAG TPA: NlpC/P60 family protein, partial [Bacillota bacterium]|nr:NlpC/P60 family protein [Bacillota bacterium]